METKQIISTISAMHPHGAWNQGVKWYALDLLEDIEDDVCVLSSSPKVLREQLLNGAEDWTMFSWSGYSFIYNEDIAKRLCNNTELKRTKDGQRPPNKNEDWLDVQARALCQAEHLIRKVIHESICPGKNM